EVCIFFVTSQHFQLPVSGNQGHRRSICPYPKQRRQRVYQRLLFGNSHGITCRQVCDCLAGNRYYAHYLIHVDLVRSAITFVASEHHRQVGSCRSEEHTSELQSRENLVCRL